MTEPMPQSKPPVDPVERSIAKPDAFAKPGAMGKQGFAKAKGVTRVRALGWKKGPGRPRKRPFDRRAVHFF